MASNSFSRKCECCAGPVPLAAYIIKDNILFSNHAFGQHYAVEELFNDKADQCVMNHEAMKYFANILNPYAMLLTRKLKEITDLNLPIDIIAPSHDAIWRNDLMWNGTEKIAHAIAREISEQSSDTVLKVFDLSKTDKNGYYDRSDEIQGDLSSISGWLAFLKQLKFKNKKAGAFGTWDCGPLRS